MEKFSPTGYLNKGYQLSLNLRPVIMVLQVLQLLLSQRRGEELEVMLIQIFKNRLFLLHM